MVKGQGMMGNIKVTIRTLPVLIITGLLFSTGAEAGTQKLSSAWLTGEIIVDGTAAEWDGVRTKIEDEDLAIGVQNDGERLYVLLVTNDPLIQRQIFVRGLTVWLDADRGKDKEFGVRFPLGALATGQFPGEAGPRAGMRGESDIDSLKAQFAKTLEVIGIVNDDNELTQFANTDPDGIYAQVGKEDDWLVYELQVPLHTSEVLPMSFQVAPGAEIDVGIETPEIDRSKMRGMMRDRMGGRGGMGGRDGMHGRGGFGGMRGGERPQIPDPLNFWTTVILAENE